MIAFPVKKKYIQRLLNMTDADEDDRVPLL